MPVQVRRAFAIWMSMIGVWLALILVRTLVTSSGPSFADNPAFAAGRVVGTLVVLGVLAVVFAFLALHFRAGRNWARITLTVLTSVGLASALLALIGGIALLVVAPVGGILIHLFSLAILGAGATAIVLAWSAPSTAYVTGTWAGR